MKNLLFILAIVVSSMIAIADDKPTFPGGDQALKQYIAEKTSYPSISKENGVEGIVSVGFIVTIDGNLTNIKVVKFVDPDLENEAIRVVSGMPKWIPAEKDGTPIEAPSTVEIPFILD